MCTPVIPRSPPNTESHAQLPSFYLEFHTGLLKMGIRFEVPLTTAPPVHSVPGALDLGVEWAADEADSSPFSRTEGKSKWSCTSSSLYVFMACTGTTFSITV